MTFNAQEDLEFNGSFSARQTWTVYDLSDRQENKSAVHNIVVQAAFEVGWGVWIINESTRLCGNALETLN